MSLEDNLFSGSPEGDLFDENSPFGKKGGRFSGGGGLFDDVMDDEDETPSKVHFGNCLSTYRIYSFERRPRLSAALE